MSKLRTSVDLHGHPQVADVQVADPQAADPQTADNQAADVQVVSISQSIIHLKTLLS